VLRWIIVAILCFFPMMIALLFLFALFSQLARFVLFLKRKIYIHFAALRLYYEYLDDSTAFLTDWLLVEEIPLTMGHHAEEEEEEGESPPLTMLKWKVQSKQKWTAMWKIFLLNHEQPLGNLIYKVFYKQLSWNQD